MALSIAMFLLGFIFLIKGADIMVDGSSSIARRFGVSSFFIGLTIVAFGTSAPEFVVSAIASFRGNNEIAMGNIIGSNISNTLLILGVAAIIRPLLVKKNTITKEIPLSLLAVFAVGILVNDFIIDGNGYNFLTRIDGIMLLLFFAIFIFYTFGITREKEGLIEKTMDELKESEEGHSVIVSSAMILVGLLGLSLGGNWIVNGATDIAKFFEISEALIGLTIVALGTSLPELATSAMAAYKGQTDIAVGNVVGSNIFNLFWVLGMSAIIRPILYNPILNFDIILLGLITVLLLFLIFIGKKNVLDRWEGYTLIGIYIFYLSFLIYRG